jgi:hypothetical protein
LIAAINLANAAAGGTLNLAANCTYTLTANNPTTGDGLPSITQPITVNGNNATIARAELTNLPFRIFDVGSGGNLSLQNLTVTGGRTPATPSVAGGGILIQGGGVARLEHVTVKNNASAALGGGVANFGFVDIGDSVVSDNNATDAGGGIFNEGSLSLRNTTLSDNLASRGGAVFNAGGAFLENATMSHNGAGTMGGGLFVDAPASSTRVDHGTITDNASETGGGVFSLSSVSFANTTISNNAAALSGGGIASFSTLVVEDSTITDNKARESGGGLFNSGPGAHAVLRRTEVSGNTVVSSTSQGGGIFNNGGTVALFASRVTDNTSVLPQGGIFSSNAGVTVDPLSVTVANRPTNCSTTVLNCFG